MEAIKRRVSSRYLIGLFAAAAILAIAGCSVIEPINPEEVMKNPFQGGAIKVGMSKAKVESLWGKPNDIKVVEDAKRWQGTRDEWIYRAEYASIPVNAGYLSKTKKLYFDGDNLTNIE